MIDLPTKALSSRQPWVWASLNVGKRIENRPRRFHYRGPICLHASLYRPTQSDVDALAEVQARLPQRLCPIGDIWGDDLKAARDQPNGGIVGTAEIVDLVEQSDSPWFFGPYGLVLENVKPVEFIPVKGALGLFDWRKKL